MAEPATLIGQIYIDWPVPVCCVGVRGWTHAPPPPSHSSGLPPQLDGKRHGLIRQLVYEKKKKKKKFLKK